MASPPHATDGRKQCGVGRLTPGSRQCACRQAAQTGRDAFLMGPSGYGFLHPGCISEDSPALPALVNATLGAAALLSASGYVHWDDYDNPVGGVSGRPQLWICKEIYVHLCRYMCIYAVTFSMLPLQSSHAIHVPPPPIVRNSLMRCSPVLHHAAGCQCVYQCRRGRCGGEPRRRFRHAHGRCAGER